MNSRQTPVQFVFILALAMLSGPTLARQTRTASASGRASILLITVDDMNWDSPGCFGGAVPDITPNIDRMAAEGMRFTNAHVTIAVCTPSRSVLLTGMYPHHNGAEGFQRIRPDVPTLPAVLGEAGYLCGTIGKSLGQPEIFKWADEYGGPTQEGQGVFGRQPQVYYRFIRDFINKANSKGCPFFIMANSHDPHRPFHGSEKDRKLFHAPGSEVPDPSRIYKPNEICVPGFLPDLPDVRTEIAQFYSSVRRADDTVGAILRALRESGEESNTLVMFLSDNGMSFPFAKSNCYLNSTRTPWIVRWPGRVKAGSVNREHFISGLDFMPTALEVSGVAPTKKLDGVSFLPLLRGEDQANRDVVFTQYYHVHAGTPYPMRCVQSKRYGHIFNPWSNGEHLYNAEPLSGLTFAAMQKAAETEPEIRQRVRLLQYRCVEEFYDVEKDPSALHNLIADPRYTSPADEMRQRLLKWMEQMGDVAIEAFRHRDSPAALQQFMREYSAKAAREIQELKEYEARTGYRF